MPKKLHALQKWLVQVPVSLSVVLRKESVSSSPWTTNLLYLIILRVEKRESGLLLSMGFGRSTIGDIKKNEDKLRSFATTMESLAMSSKGRKVMRLADDEKLDKAVYLWLSSRLKLSTLSKNKMATKTRGRSLARQIKVTDSCSSPLKKGRQGSATSSCDIDVVSSKPTHVGRDATEAPQDTDTVVSRCGSKKCKTCKHIVEGDSFCSNTTGKKYTVKSREAVMTCATQNVIYLISCKKCGIQYVGETSQTLRSRMNNHRHKLNQMCDLFFVSTFLFK